MLQPGDQQQRAGYGQREADYDGGGGKGEIHACILFTQCAKLFFSIDKNARIAGMNMAGKSWQVVDARRSSAVRGKCFRGATGASFAMRP